MGLKFKRQTLAAGKGAGREPQGKAQKVTDPFYQSRAWRRLAGLAKKLAGGRCCRCGSNERVIADHVIERRDGGAELELSNIQILCHACHERKTADARLARAAGL